LTIYHFGQALQYIRDGLGACPTARSQIETNLLKLAQKKFNAYFSEFEDLRHAIAHVSELWKNVQNFAKNAITGHISGSIQITAMNASVVIRNNLVRRKFSTTIDKRLVSYEISAETLNKLISVKNEFYSAFRPAEVYLRDLTRKDSKTS